MTTADAIDRAMPQSVHRTTAARTVGGNDRDDFARLLARAVRYAALRHDIGKASRFFQKKLAKLMRVPDPIRHEILSLLIAMEFSSDPQASFRTLFRRAAKRAAKLGPSSELIGSPSSLPDVGDWLVATHHRLFASEIWTRPSLAAHIVSAAPADLSSNLAPSGDLFEEPGFRAAMIESELRGQGVQTPLEESVCEALFLYGRASLALCDHDVSTKVLAPGSSGAFANSASASRPAQDLAMHLMAAFDGAERSVRAILDLGAGTGLPFLDRVSARSVPLNGRSMRSMSVSPFAWQVDAVALAHRVSQQSDLLERGSFTVICASTGSGKTRGAVDIAAALSGGRVRLATLLGLRSLTLQTADAYSDQAGIPRSSMAVLVGSREVRAIHESRRTGAAGGFGSDSNLTDTEPGEIDEIVVDCENASVWQLPEIYAAQLSTHRKHQMLAAPVLVCTVDYLMQAADWRRSGRLVAQLRLMSSDILLDEIDAYDLEDYPAIARLCYLAGVFGRRVILSSATALSEVVTPLYDAYRAGRRAHAMALGKRDEVDVMLVSDSVEPEHAVMTGWAPEFRAAYDGFLSRISSACRRRQVVLRRGRCQTFDSVAELLDGCVELHDGNHVLATRIRPGDASIRVSAGLIRVARVRDALALCRSIVDAGAGLSSERRVFVKVVPYHANLLLAVRSHTEAWIDEALCRHPRGEAGIDGMAVAQGADPLCTAARPMLEEAARAGATDLIIIVVATPVEEVGRDHDFDWAIIEPSSTRSVVQCSGRVNRHRRRHIETGRINVIVMRLNFRHLEGKRAVFRAPGVERFTRPFPSHDMLDIAPALCETPREDACLSGDISDALPRWERREIGDFLRASVREAFLGSILSKLTSGHFDRFRFRSADRNAWVYFSPDTRIWRYAWRVPGQSDAGVEIEDVAAEIRLSNCPIEDSPHWFISPVSGLEPIVSGLRSRLDRSCQSCSDEEFFSRFMGVNVPQSYLERGSSRADPRRILAHPVLGIFVESSLPIPDQPFDERVDPCHPETLEESGVV